jgi:hypothetical protein
MLRTQNNWKRQYEVLFQYYSNNLVELISQFPMINCKEVFGIHPPYPLDYIFVQSMFRKLQLFHTHSRFLWKLTEYYDCLGCTNQ